LFLIIYLSSKFKAFLIASLFFSIIFEASSLE
jgi:hypothetical protein